MKKSIIVFGIILLSIYTGFPQESKLTDNNNIKYDKSGNIKYIKFDETFISSIGIRPSSSDEFFGDILNLKKPNQFSFENKVEYEDGSNSKLYRQFYDTIKVEGGIYILIFRNGELLKASGHVIPVKDINISPSITPEQACQSFLDYLKLGNLRLPEFFHDLVIAGISAISGQDTVDATKLCYKVQMLNVLEDKGEIGYIDAHTGILLKTVTTLSFVDNATFNTLYSNQRSAATQYFNGTYRLFDSSRGAVIHTWDLNNTYDNADEIFDNRVEFTDNNNNWETEEHQANYDQVAQDIHWGMQKIYDYFYSNHNSYSSFDNQNADIDAYAHTIITGLATAMDNAAHEVFLNGYEAFFFTDGLFSNHPVGSIDIVAHEYAHAITYHKTGLNQDYIEQNSMIEGLSDIWGVITENATSIALNDTDKECWKIGEEIINLDGKDCIRNIQNPGSSSSRTQIADFYQSSTYNSGNVYVKSGIMSHWFYLLAMGGTGANNWPVSGIGINKAAKIVFHGHTEGFANVENYEDARVAMIDAAEIAFPNSGLEPWIVANTWHAVGVGTHPAQLYIDGDSFICPIGATYTIANLPSNSSVSWSSSYNIDLTPTGNSNSILASPNAAGSGWLRATVISPYNTSVTLDQYNITIASSPWLYNIVPEYGNYYGYEGESYSFHVWPENFSNYSFSIYPPYAYINWTQNAVANIYFPNPGTYTISATTNNGSCTSNKVSLQFDVYGMDYSLSPNPASNEVTVTITADKSDNSVGFSMVDKIFDVSIFDIYGVLKIRKKFSGEKLSIPIHNLKDGEYLVRIDNGKTTSTKRLIIKH